MGNKLSMPTQHIFKKELEKLNGIVTNIIDDNNLFKNTSYNFLSQDVCEKHTIVMEEDLKKHLKVSLQDLGRNILVIPNNENDASKKVICKKISSHYMRILYLLTLIKYVYDLEHNGDLSVAGIMFRNITIQDDIMSIAYCNMPQKDYSRGDDTRVDFKDLEGLAFFVDYVLDKDEVKVFANAWKAVVERSAKPTLKTNLCKLTKNNVVDKRLISSLRTVGVQCGGGEVVAKVAKDNPVFAKHLCYDVKKIVLKLGTSQSKAVEKAFKTMRTNYSNNISSIEELLNRLISPSFKGGYELKDISKVELDDVIQQVKVTIMLFYLQSLLDYQNLLDIAKTNHNIQLNE